MADLVSNANFVQDGTMSQRSRLEAETGAGRRQNQPHCLMLTIA